MGKKKKNICQKLGLSDRVANKKRTASTKINPFELHINKQKFNVMGKMRKFEKGLPGISRSKATKLRKETLLREYKVKYKSNKFIDRRIGEYDSKMSKEDKMLVRFAKERQKSFDKAGNIFSLNEDEGFLPYGQTLADIEKFATKRVDSDDDDDIHEKIAEDLVLKGHFGGGGNLNNDEDNGETIQRKSHKEFMEELIVRSKQEKAAKQLEREKTRDLTDRLDQEWKLLSTEFAAGLQTRKDMPSAPADDYDVLVKQLMFEAKATATDRLKTEEELALEAKLKLEKLEADRILRMRGLSEEKTKSVNHRSADDLDDGFILDHSDERIALCYTQDGDMMLPEKAKRELKGILKKLNEQKIERSEIQIKKQRKESEESDNSEEDNGKNNDESTDDDESDDDENDDDDESDDDENDDDESNGDETNEDEQNTNFEEDIQILDSSDSEADEKISNLMLPNAFKQLNKKVKFQEVEQTGEKVDKTFLAELKRKKIIMESARKQLPFTFMVPETFNEFQKILCDHSIEDQVIIVDRTIKCTHPSLGEGNKKKLENLFGFILQHIGELSGIDAGKSLLVTDKMTPFLFSLVQFISRGAGQCLLGIIKAKQKELEESLKKTRKAFFPGLDAFIYLKLISILFSTSDFHHSTVTPAMLYMSQLLTQCILIKQRDILAGLYLCNMFYEYVSFSKRFAPEAINFVYGILLSSLPQESRKNFVAIPPCHKLKGLLEIANPTLVRQIEVKKFSLGMLMPQPNDATIDDEFSVQCVNAALFLSLRFAELYDPLPSFKDIFHPLLKVIELLPDANYPEQILELKNSFLKYLRKPKSYPMLILQSKKPQTIQQLDPEIIDNFDPIRKKFARGSTEFKERQKLKNKYKHELKGALREIRKDSQFLAKERLKEKLLLDKERIEKTKRIMSHLKIQEGDYKALKKNPKQ